MRLLNVEIRPPTLLILVLFALAPRSAVSGAEPDSPAALRSDAPPPAFSLMTWNLEWFFDDSKQDNYSKLALEKSAPSRGQWNQRRDAVAGAIASVQPTIVAVQEIEGQRILWYLAGALDREHALKYEVDAIEGSDRYTEQDVGLLTTGPADVLSIMRGNVTSRMQKSGQYGGVSKHLAALVEIPVGEQTETILIVNVHLRSGVAGAGIRAKQAASLNHWIRVWEQLAAHLIVVGDFNTDEVAGHVSVDSEMSILKTRSTPDPSDDLVDLLEMVPPSQRQTHLLAGKQFDRILVSRTLVEDDPQQPDLCLRGVQVRPDLAIRGRPDTADEHWQHFWQLPDGERDLSDHYPIIAEFDIR